MAVTTGTLLKIGISLLVLASFDLTNSNQAALKSSEYANKLYCIPFHYEMHDGWIEEHAEDMYDISSLQSFAKQSIVDVIRQYRPGKSDFDPSQVRLVAIIGKDRFVMDKSGNAKLNSETLVYSKKLFDEIKSHLRVIIPPFPKS